MKSILILSIGLLTSQAFAGITPGCQPTSDGQQLCPMGPCEPLGNGQQLCPTNSGCQPLADGQQLCPIANDCVPLGDGQQLCPSAASPQ